MGESCQRNESNVYGRFCTYRVWFGIALQKSSELCRVRCKCSHGENLTQSFFPISFRLAWRE